MLFVSFCLLWFTIVQVISLFFVRFIILYLLLLIFNECIDKCSGLHLLLITHVYLKIQSRFHFYRFTDKVCINNVVLAKQEKKKNAYFGEIIDCCQRCLWKVLPYIKSLKLNIRMYTMHLVKLIPYFAEIFLDQPVGG